MTTLWSILARLLLVAWALGSAYVALAPVGWGGIPRVVNAVAFMMLGPAVAIMWRLLRRTPVAAFSPPLAFVIAMATSLSVLVLSSITLLLLGVWTVEGVVAVVTATVVSVAVWPHRREVPAVGDMNNPASPRTAQTPPRGLR